MSSTNRSPQDAGARAIDVSVCIATYRRPQGLRRLLDSLRDDAREAAFVTEIVVVDNDRSESARSTVENEISSFPMLRYVVEPRQSIAHARNAGVRAARGTWVAFIDDDEEAEPGWLAAYWRASRGGNADGFFGPVIPVAEQPAPRWFHADVFFAYGEHPDGSRIDATSTRTGNAFVRHDLLGDEPFDPAFGLTGGSDFELFSRLLDRGATFRWCAGARTRDYLPASRLRLGWLLQRAFRGGWTWTTVERRRRPGPVADLRRISRALGGMAVFAFLLPLDAVRGWAALTHRLRRLCVQAGHLWVYLGAPVEPYRDERSAARPRSEDG